MRFSILRRICLFGFAAGLALSAAGQATLPYITDFDPSFGFTLGPLNGQQGWVVLAGSADITNTTSYLGTQSIALEPGSTAPMVGIPFAAPSPAQPVIYVDCILKPVASSSISSFIYLDTSLAVLVRNDGAGGGQIFALDGSLGWVPTPAVFAINNSNNTATDWMRLTFRLDFTAKTWDLYYNGAFVAHDVAFLDDSLTYLPFFMFQGDPTAPSYLNLLYAGSTNLLFTDVNNDGIRDDWETAYGLSLSVNQRDLDPDGDGRTNLEEYIGGTDPTDYYNGALPVITSLVDSSGRPAAHGLVSVKVTRASDGSILANAPVTLTLTTGAGAIAATSGGTGSTSVTVRTDSTGIAQAYVNFISFSPDVLVATAQSGSQTASISINLRPPFLYATDFEASEGYTPGSLDGQQGWNVDSGSAEISGSDSFAGAQSVILQPDPLRTDLFQSFSSDPGQPIVFVDFYARPVADSDVNASTQFWTESADLGFQKVGGHGEVYVFDGDGSGPGWVDTGRAIPLNADNQAAQWVRFTLRLNYSAHTWDLYVDGRLAIADVASIDSSASFLSIFGATGHTGVLSRLDHLSAGYDNPLFTDADKDGMDDAWELAHGLNPAVDDRNLDPDHDGLTNIQEYLHGTDPQNRDTDGDGVSDGREVRLGLNPADPTDASLSQYPEVPPNPPGNVSVASQTGGNLGLQWAVATPGQNGEVTQYDVYLNGTKIATTSGTNISIPYTPSASLLQFFSVRAVDDQGGVSASSHEVLMPGLQEAVDAQRQEKIASGSAGKGGILTPSGRWYKNAVFTADQFEDNYDVSSGNQVGHSERSVSITQVYDSASDHMTNTITGGLDVSFNDPGNGGSMEFHGKWIIDPANPNLRVILDDPNAPPLDIDQDLVYYLPSAGPSHANPGNVSSDYYQDDFGHAHFYGSQSLQVSNEYTDEEMIGHAHENYALAASARGGLDWNQGIGASGGQLDPAGHFLDGLPFLAGYRPSVDSFGFTDTLTLTGGIYRWVSQLSGLVHFRWAEIFYPEDSSTPRVLAVREETVNGGSVSGTSTNTYSLEPPSTAGTIDLQLLPAGIQVQTPSMTPTLGEARLYAVDSVFVGEVAEIGAPLDADNTTAAILQTSGDATSVQLVEVDPQVVAGQGMAVAIGQGIQPVSGADLWPALSAGRQLVAVGLAPGALSLDLKVTTFGVTYDLTKTITVYAKPELAVDANRDGEIHFASEKVDASQDDSTSSDKPFRFWLNDEVDGYSSAPGESQVQDSLGSGLSNWLGHQVTCIRDLENFARLWIDMKGSAAMLTAPGNTLQIGLKWQNVTGSPAINIYASADTTGSTSYLTDPSGTAEQAQIAAPFGQAITDKNGKQTVDTTGTFILPASVWSGLTDANPVGHFLFEGAGEGTGQLTLVILDANGNELGTGPSVYLDLKDIKELYERWTVGDGNGGTPASIAGISTDRLPSGVQGLQYSSGSPGLSVPGDPNQNAYILFVHGWNLPPWEKDAFAETALKRLYWQGYKGKFGTFEWPTTYVSSAYESFAPVLEIAIYDDGEYSAWQSAVPLRQLLGTLHGSYGSSVYLLAHSMGNVVAGEALRLAGQSGAGQLVNTYVASQAAVPANCYDPTLTGTDLLDFSSVNVNGVSIPGAYGPTTPNIYNNWMMPPNPAMSAKANFYNANDYALNYWQGDQKLKPDSGLYTYYYLGSASDNPARDLFGKSLLGVGEALYLGNATNVQDRYQIMAYASEPRSKALGGVSDAAGFTPSSLQALWPQDNFSQPNGLYSSHPWHSAQFRFTNADQEYYWQQIMIKFGNVPNPLPAKP